MNVSLKVTLNITYCERMVSWVRILVGFFRGKRSFTGKMRL